MSQREDVLCPSLKVSPHTRRQTSRCVAKDGKKTISTNRRAKTPQRNTSPRSPLKIESRLQDVKTAQRSSARLHVQITNGHESSDGKSQSFLPNARTIQAGTSDPAPICPQTLLSPTRCVLDKQAHNFAHRLCSENAECMKQHIYCFAHRLSLVRGLRK